MKNFNKSTLAAAVGTAALALAATTPVQAESSWSLSGWINQGLTYADNSDASDIVSYADNGNTLGSRLTFAGSTDLPNTGMNAGFEVILEPMSGGLGFGTNNRSGISGGVGAFDNQNGDVLNVLGHSVHVGGNWGKFTLGLQSMPTDNIAVLADPSLTLWSSISPVFRGNGILIGNTGGTAAAGSVYGDLMGCYTAPQLAGNIGIGIDCNGIYRQGVRYDLPTFIDNLNIAVGYANDDVYDVAAKYNTQLGRVKTIVHLGYAQNNGPQAFGTNTGRLFDSADNFQAQLGLMDPQTGLFGTFAYQAESVDRTAAGRNVGGSGNAIEEDTDAYWLKVGVKRKFNSLGDTSFAFQYGSYNDQYGAFAAAGVTGSEVQRLGLEVNQYFGDKLIMYGVWENLDVEADGTTAFARALDSGDELDTFTLGLTYFF